MTPVFAKTFSIESRELWFQLRQVYLQEELLRPVFVWGVGIGTLLLLLALLLRDERLKLTSLILLAAAGLAVIPYLDLRGKVARQAHPGVEPSAKVSRLRQESRWVFVTLGGLGVGHGTVGSAHQVWRSAYPRHPFLRCGRHRDRGLAGGSRCRRDALFAAQICGAPGPAERRSAAAHVSAGNRALRPEAADGGDFCLDRW